MRRPLSLVLPMSAALSGLLALLIMLARVVFAAQGGQIVYQSNPNGYWDIYLLDLQTGVAHDLTPDHANDTTPSWSPDGSQIAFISDRDGENQSELYVMNADGSHPQRISSDDSIYLEPSWTPDGKAVILTRGYEQIYRLDTATHVKERLGVGFAPRLSPDGKRLLFYADGTSGASLHVYVLNLAANLITDLTPGTTHNWGGAWSPDGQRIAFASPRAGKTGIYLMNADGSNTHSISASGNDIDPAWSPDGTQIVYASGVNGAMQLYVVNADGSGRRQVTASNGDHLSPTWRPQSR